MQLTLKQDLGTQDARRIDDHQPAYDVGVLRREQQREGTARRVAQHVDFARRAGAHDGIDRPSQAFGAEILVFEVGVAKTRQIDREHVPMQAEPAQDRVIVAAADVADAVNQNQSRLLRRARPCLQHVQTLVARRVVEPGAAHVRDVFDRLVYGRVTVT
jgi:hypothetical protein